MNKGSLKNVLLACAAFSSLQVMADDIKADFYGQIRFDAIYDTAEFNSAQSPIVVRNLPAGRKSDAEVNMHPRLTRLGVDLSQHNDELDLDIDGKVEVDFQNGGSQSRELLRLRHGYVTLSKGEFALLVGQTWQTVSRQIPMANGDTLMWGAGNTGDRSPQIRASYGLPIDGESKVTVEAALQQMGTVDAKGQVGTNFGSEFAYQGRVAFETPLLTSKPMMLAFAYHYGRETLTEKGFGEKVFPQRGIFAEAVVPVFDGFEIVGEYFEGENLTDLRGGILFGLNPLTDSAVSTKGYWAEARAQVCDDVTLGLGYGADNPKNPEVPAGFPGLNEAAWLVAHYNLTDSVRIGMEYIQWATEYKLDRRLTSDRYDAHILWAF